jgi:hypothetical protein
MLVFTRMPLMLTGVAVEKLLPANLPKIKSRQDAPQTKPQDAIRDTLVTTCRFLTLPPRPRDHLF